MAGMNMKPKERNKRFNFFCLELVPENSPVAVTKHFDSFLENFNLEKEKVI